MQARPYLLTLLLDLTNAPVAAKEGEKKLQPGSKILRKAFPEE